MSTARTVRGLILFPALIAIIAGAALLLLRDAPPRAIAQSQPSYDNWEGRDYWYNQSYPSGDTFPLAREYITVGATVEPGESAPCATIASTVWAQYYAEVDGTLTITARGSDVPTVIAVYEWDIAGQFLPSPPGGNLTPVACEAAAEETDPRNAISFQITQDKTYMIQMGSRVSGEGTIRVQAECRPCAPTNDRSQRPGEIYVDEFVPSVTATRSTVDATLDAGEPRRCGNVGKTVWWVVYSNIPMRLSIDTAGSSFDTVLAVYADANWDAAQFDGQFISCNASPGGRASTTLDMEQYRTYWIQAGGIDGAGGDLVLTVACVPGCPPYNDSFASAAYYELPAEGIEARTGFATLEDDEPRPCGGIGKTVWYQLQSYGPTTVVVDAAGSDIDTVIAAYTGVSLSPPGGAAADDIGCAAASNGRQPRLTLEMEPFVPVWVQAGGRNGEGGRIALSFTCTPGPCPPPGDHHASQYWSFSVPYSENTSIQVDSRGATTQEGERLDCGNMGKTMWFILYPSASAVDVILDTAGSSYDTAIAIYEGPFESAPLGDFRRIACAEGGPGQRASVQARVQAAADGEDYRVYLVQVGGRGGASGDLLVSFRCDGPCPPEHDSSRTPRYLYPPYAEVINTAGATTEPGEPTSCGNIGKTVWYTLQVGPGTYSVEAIGGGFQGVAAVYEITGFSPPGGLTQTLAGCFEDGKGTFTTREGIGYLLQVGGANGAGGTLETRLTCDSCPNTGGAPGQGGGGVRPVGSVIGPDTGSGGYLRGSRRE